MTPPPRRVYVIAGSAGQAENWRHRRGLSRREAVFVVDASQLLGLRECEIAWTGTYWERRDFDRLLAEVRRLEAVSGATVRREEV